MATSKSKISEQVIRQIGKYTDESDIDERDYACDSSIPWIFS